MQSKEMIELFQELYDRIDPEAIDLKEKLNDAIHCLTENVHQLKLHSNKNNILEPSAIRLIDGITFKNSHLAAEYLIKKDINIANALYEELKSQIKIGA